MKFRRTPCVICPCRRCEKSDRSSWRSREAWHAKRRRERIEFILAPIVGVVFAVAAWNLVIFTVWLVAR